MELLDDRSQLELLVEASRAERSTLIKAQSSTLTERGYKESEILEGTNAISLC